MNLLGGRNIAKNDSCLRTAVRKSISGGLVASLQICFELHFLTVWFARKARVLKNRQGNLASARNIV